MKIVSLLPSASEIICALGLFEHLVAVSHECDAPPEVARLPRITSSILPHDLGVRAIDEAVSAAVREGRPLYTIDGDLLARLEPDLVVTQGVCDVCAVSTDTVAATLKLLPDALPSGAHVLSLNGTTIAGVWRDIMRVGETAGVAERAAALVDELSERWARVQHGPPLASRPRVSMLEWPDPPFYGGHWVPEMVAAAGGTDAFAHAGERSARISWTQIQKADPDLIVLIACGYDLAANLAFAEALFAHPQAGALRAVRTGQVWAADANAFFSRPGPRLVTGTEALSQVFAGKAVPGVIERVVAVPS